VELTFLFVVLEGDVLEVFDFDCLDSMVLVCGDCI